MSQRITIGLAVLVLAVGLLALAPDSIARRVSVFDQLDLLVDVRHEIVQNFVEEPDQEQMVESAVRGMIESLEDPYTVYISPEELEPFDKQVRGTFSGIGAEVTIDEKLNRLKIVSPLEDSPAWQSGVMAGDIVLDIEGESTEGMTINEAVAKLTGQEGTDVTIRVRHENGEEQVITITRAQINIQTVKGIRRNAENQWDFMLDEDQQIGYVRLTQFTQKTVEELRDALAQLDEQGAEAMILDLRFDPGGLLDAAVSVSDMFLDGGQRIVSIKGRSTPERVFESTDAGTVTDIPVVVLANENSASASEIVTGALADNDRARFIGTRTFGKGSVQHIRMLEEGRGAIKLTHAHYYLPSGRNIHRRPDAEVWGVDPEDGFYVPMTTEEVREMIKVRREGDVLRSDNGDAGDITMSPEWIRDTLKDPQLAAGLEAMQGYLETGDWPKVGLSGVDELTKLQRREVLRAQRDLLQERLLEIQEELASLNQQAPDQMVPDDAVEEADAQGAEADPAGDEE